MATYIFKSVGQTINQVKASADVVTGSLSPIGFKTPLQYGDSSEGVFAMHFKLEDQLRDNLKNLILTNWGERVMFYDLGANLRELVTEYTNVDAFDQEAMRRISTAVGKWLPYVVLKDYSSSIDSANTTSSSTVVNITLTYDIPLLGVSSNKIAVSISTIG